MRDTGIADRLRAFGLNVVEVAGWQSRGSDSFNPKGSVDHHTAGPASGNAPSLGICINGRAGLAGPLCNVLVARDNTCYVIAAGRANHAGLGGWRGLSGNSSVYGVERENVGYGDREPWREDQTDTAARVHAALLQGKNVSYLCEHKEWAPTRKIDAHTVDGNELRARTANYLNQSPAPSPTPTPIPTPTPGTKWVKEAGTSLEFGEYGPRTKAWQTDINAIAGAGLSTDGYFGQGTKDKTQNFQAFFGLGVDGVVGPQTRGTMDAVKAAAAAKPKPPVINRPSIKEGSVGVAVGEWQGILNKVSGAGIRVDRHFGRITATKTRDFQRFFGLTADGIVGPATWNVGLYMASR